MRLICTLFLLLAGSLTGFSQNLTGIWRGYFLQKNVDMVRGRINEERYKYEIQINNLSNNALRGVTYSYRTTVFYGKASMEGIYNAKTKVLIIKETKMLEQKVAPGSDACPMTCYFDYKKENNKEILEGTFTSTVNNSIADCGSGTVYLEKVTTTDFEKEPFLAKKENNLPKTLPATVNKPNSPLSYKEKIKQLQKELGLTPDGVAGPNTLLALRKKDPSFKGNITSENIDKLIHEISKNKSLTTNKFKPGGENNLTANKSKTSKRESGAIIVSPNDSIVLPPNANAKPMPPVPRILKERSNELAKVIKVNVQDVKIDFYDNGIIDNDSITVYHNNEMVVSHQRLSYKPITIHIHLDVNNPIHEVIVTADNLGDIPPNTCLMVITAGKRYEVSLASDDKRNAKVILEYTPNETKVN